MRKHSVLKFLIWCLFTIAMTHTAQSDSPPPVAKDVKVFSSNRHFYAFSKLRDKKTLVFAVSNKQKALWEVPGYHPVLFLSDDGQYLVIGYPGGNLFSPDVKVSDTFLCFYRSGHLVREVRISEVFPSLGDIPETTSGKMWGNYFGFDKRNHFILLLFDGKRVAFDASTGQKLDH